MAKFHIQKCIYITVKNSFFALSGKFRQCLMYIWFSRDKKERKTLNIRDDVNSLFLFTLTYFFLHYDINF